MSGDAHDMDRYSVSHPFQLVKHRIKKTVPSGVHNPPEDKRDAPGSIAKPYTWDELADFFTESVPARHMFSNDVFLPTHILCVRKDNLNMVSNSSFSI